MNCLILRLNRQPKILAKVGRVMRAAFLVGVALLLNGFFMNCFSINGAVAQSPETSEEEEEEDNSLGFDASSQAPDLPPILLRANPERVSTVFTSSLQGVLAPLPPGAVSSIPPLQRDSVVAYQNGDYPLALGLHFANAIVDPDTAQETFSQAQYNSNLRRPLWATRFGVAMAIRGDTAATLSPIVPGMKGPSEMNDSRGGGFDDGMDDEVTNSRNGSAAPLFARRPMVDTQVDALMRSSVGLVAEMFASEFDSRYRAGKFGSALADVTARPPAKSRRDASQSGDDEPVSIGGVIPTESLVDMMDSAPEPLPLWKPGLLFLPEVGSDEAIEIGRRMGLDFLIQFDVIIKDDKPRSRSDRSSRGQSAAVENTSRVRLYHVGSGKSLGTSKAINNIECSTLVTRRQYPDNEGYVEAQLRGLWIAVDRFTALKPLPALNEESARRRMGQLFADQSGDVVQMLAEARLYESRGWLTSDEVEMAFDILAGTKGLAMIHGPKKEQRELVRDLVIKSLRASSADE